MDTKVVFSGVQPTAALTLGNYLGAIRNFVDLQHQARCYFCVVDQHALTIPQEPAALRQRTLDLARLFLAAGLNPDIATIFVQSHVPAHSQLSWLFECLTYVGELRRMTQFKDKSKKQEAVTTGLMTYPVLMAADILLYDATHVPVGEDQKQHLELARDIAERFNNRFGPTFVVPEPYIPPRQSGGRIMSLTEPTRKMSKSDENPDSYILLTDTPEIIRNKIKRATTDADRAVRYDVKNKPGVSNLMVILSLATGKTFDEISKSYDGYAQFKKDVADAVIAVLEPIQLRYASPELNAPGALEAILAHGAAQANAVAAPKLAEVQEKMGLIVPGRVAVEAGADFVGFNFAATRRYVPPEIAEAIGRELPGSVGRVGLFVDADAFTVQEVARVCGLDYVQLCGDESPDFVREVGMPAIKSLRVRGPEIAEEVARFADQVAWCILDAYQPGARGGTGVSFDWRLAEILSQKHQIMLAGGLDPGNVARAIATAHPWGVDVSSGVETDGDKDPEKIYQFVKAAKGCGSV